MCRGEHFFQGLPHAGVVRYKVFLFGSLGLVITIMVVTFN